MVHKNDEDEEEEFSGRPLTIAERKMLRRMIENESRIQWFWGSVRVWAGWISGAIIGAWALVEIGRKIWTKSF